VIWLLSLFPLFRQLQTECARLTTDKLVLQDRLDAALEDRSKLWDLTRECINNERTAFQMQINAQWQKQGFGAPYPDAPHLPPAAVPDISGGTAGRAQMQTPSARSALQTADFLTNWQRQQHQTR
jgi:hypothetical protein